MAQELQACLSGLQGERAGLQGRVNADLNADSSLAAADSRAGPRTHPFDAALDNRKPKTLKGNHYRSGCGVLGFRD